MWFIFLHFVVLSHSIWILSYVTCPLNPKIPFYYINFPSTTSFCDFGSFFSWPFYFCGDIVSCFGYLEITTFICVISSVLIDLWFFILNFLEVIVFEAIWLDTVVIVLWVWAVLVSAVSFLGAHIYWKLCSYPCIGFLLKYISLLLLSPLSLILCLFGCI